MAEKSKVREITIVDEGGTFDVLLRRFRGKKEYDFKGIAMLRKLLSNEKARMLHVLKNEKVGSIYELAKKLKRNFKSVNDDIKLLEKFGFVDMIAEKTGNRKRLKPLLVVDAMHFHLKI